MTTPADTTVRLEIPASARFVATARVVAAARGADAGLTVDELEDLRLGVDELLSVLISGAAPDGRVTLTVGSQDGEVVVSGELDGDAHVPPPDELTVRIVSAVADEHDIGPRGFRLVKIAAPRER